MKNTSHNPLIDESDFRHVTLDEQAVELFGKHYYLSSLMDISPRTIMIAFEEEYPELKTLQFPFIEEKGDRVLDGVRIRGDIQFEED